MSLQNPRKKTPTTTNKQNKTKQNNNQTLPLLHSQVLNLHSQVLSSKCAVQKNTVDKRKTDQTNSQPPKITEAH
jgi:hypothetical protein